MTIDDVARVLNGKVLVKEEGLDRHVGAVVAFTGLCRQVVPSLLVNGQEVLMQLNLAELARAMDKVAYLRKKKLLSRRQVKG